MFEGALTALATPMRDGEPDFNALCELVERQIEAGIDGLVPCGTTGEAATLTGDERARVVRTVVEQARGRVPVLAGAGSNNTGLAVAGGRMVREMGADGQLQVTPYYNKPSQEMLVAHFQAVAVGTELPMVLYNVPGRTCCDMLPPTIARLADVQSIVGVKEATGSLQRAQQVIASCPDDFSVLSGDDFTCAGMTLMGGDGVISVVSNLMPAQTARMIRAAREGRAAEARELHDRMAPLMDLLFCEPNPVPVKAGLSLLGLSGNEVRLPLLPLGGEKLDALREAMDALGLLP